MRQQVLVKNRAMKGAWQVVPLGAVLGIQNGYAFSSKKFSESVGTPLIRIRDLKDSGASAIRFEGSFDPNYIVRSGDLLIGMDGEFVCYEWAGADALLNQRVCRLTDFSGDLLPRFVYYGINKFLKEIEERTSYTTVKHLSSKKIASIEFPMPPLEEQKRIVAVLDQAFAALDRARAHAEANRESSRELFGTLLEVTLRRDASDWKRRSLKSLGTTQTGTTPKASEAESYGDFIPFIKPGDFKLDGSLELEKQGLSALGAKKARTVPAGSALMVCIGATIGKAGFTETEIVTNQQINSIFPRDGVSGEFLYYQFITPSFQKEVMRRSGQATLPIINKSKWSDIEVFIPSDLATQLRIVETLREIRHRTEQLIARYDQKLTELATLRQSLLQKAFAGRL